MSDSERLKTLVRVGAMAGVGLLGGIQKARGAAHAASRVPTVGHLLSLAVLGAGAVSGLVEAAKAAAEEA